MNFPIKISPSILSADYGNLTHDTVRAEKGGGSEIHIDIMDGHYCHNFSFGIDVIPALKKNVRIPLVAHLEIDNPDVFVEDFAHAGSDTIVVQEDTCPHLPRTIANIKSRGLRAGIGINPDRGFEKIEANPEILSDIELLIIMAAYPGYGGQPFSPVTIQKIEKSCVLRSKYGARFDIGVDGAVNIKTVAKIVKAGANYLIAGSSIFRDDVTKNIKILKEIADETMRTVIV
jgi:ribulose-phosphate 3-epimerase